MKSFDVIVIGVGGMGSSTCYHLAKCGLKVLGLEQFDLGHAKGSSHGESRIIRKSYFEHPDYVPLLDRAYTLWKTLEEESGERLFYKTGLCYFADAGSPVTSGVRESAKIHKIEIEDLDETRVRREFPMYSKMIAPEMIYESNAGYLKVEKCVLAHIKLARQKGAEIMGNSPVISWSASVDGIHVKTERQTYVAPKVVFAGGSWTTRLLKDLGLPLEIQQKVTAWFTLQPHSLYKPDMPCFLTDFNDAQFYGFPPVSEMGLKIAEHATKTPEVIEDPASPHPLSQRDLGRLANFAAKYLPNLAPKPGTSNTCLYTMTPDQNFIMDHFISRQGATDPRISIACGFSGHGFKFASVVGEIMADLATIGKTKLPIEFLGLNRFAKSH